MERLELENFKCFHHKFVDFNQLTVLAGANGNGKSTAIQAILFLRRTIEHCGKWVGEDKLYDYSEINGLNVELNGPYCLALGNSNLVISKNSDKDFILMGLECGDKDFHVVYDVQDGADLWLKPVEVKNSLPEKHSFFLQEFYYLNAERIGPRITQGIRFFDFPSAGFQGEFVAQLLSDTNANYKFKIDKRRRNSDSKSPRLEQQLNAWLNYLMPGVSVTASYSTETHSAQIKVDNHYTQGDSTISTNIGFGISYVLPILVTGLIAREGAYMIIENPEAHLHPSAQSKIGYFLSIVAKSGVKVIVETHSDHVINGIQIAVVKKEIETEKVTINFFSQNEFDKQPHIESISINVKGELSKWPKGFFDQSQIDFAELHKYRRS